MVENIDTYATVSEADRFVSELYHPAHPLRVTWEILTETEKESFLSVALERIENLNYIGKRASYWQPLKFPRIARGIPVNFDQAPLEVKRAQTAWALEVLREELYVKRRNTDACKALGIIEQNTPEGVFAEDVMSPPSKVRELLKRWLTDWRKI